MPAERRAAPAASVEVDVAGLRIRIDAGATGPTADLLERVFGTHARPPRPRPHARLRVTLAPRPRAWRATPVLAPRAAAALLPVLGRTRAPRYQRLELTRGLAAMLASAPAALVAERELAGAGAPTIFPWGGGAFVGDLARPGGTLLLSAGRSWRDVRAPLLNAHGLLLAALAIGRGGLLLHSAAVVTGGAAWLLVGRSGAGKSTLSGRAPGAALSDDGVLVLPRRGRFVAASTPLRQRGARDDERERRPDEEVPLGGLLLLRQARRNAVRRVSPAAALAEVISQHVHYLALLPPALARRALRNVAALLARAPAYRLHFTHDADARRLLAAAGLVPGDDARVPGP